MDDFDMVLALIEALKDREMMVVRNMDNASNKDGAARAMQRYLGMEEVANRVRKLRSDVRGDFGK